MVPATELSSPSRHTYQAGILWPHHSCRLMHQSLMLSSHLQYVLCLKSHSLSFLYCSQTFLT